MASQPAELQWAGKLTFETNPKRGKWGLPANRKMNTDNRMLFAFLNRLYMSNSQVCGLHKSTSLVWQPTGHGGPVHHRCEDSGQSHHRTPGGEDDNAGDPGMSGSRARHNVIPRS